MEMKDKVNESVAFLKDAGIQQVEFGIVLGAGLEHNFLFSKIIFDFRYSYGLSSIYKSSHIFSNGKPLLFDTHFHFLYYSARLLDTFMERRENTQRYSKLLQD